MRNSGHDVLNQLVNKLNAGEQAALVKILERKDQ
jgi:hypothetical protein